MKKICCGLLIGIFLCLSVIPVCASPDENYGKGSISYIYDYQGASVAVPAAYSFWRSVSAADIGVTEFQELSSITVENNRYYFIDKGTKRIVVTDENFHLIKEITDYSLEGQKTSFGTLSSITVKAGKIYVVDSDGYIVQLDEQTFETVRVYERPEIAILDSSYTYSPRQVAVDYAGNMYIIADGINQGLLQLDNDGVFQCFIGAPKVVPDLLDLIWRRFLTEKQISQMSKFVPTEYNSIDMDESGFFYLTSQSTDIAPISRLNSQGINVLKSPEDNTPKGDGDYLDAQGQKLAPYFVDISVEEDGRYHVLDVRRGRIFTYSASGYLLFVTGYLGSRQDAFISPVALETSNGNLLVADKSKNVVSIFTPTQFCYDVINALRAQESGDYSQARILWESVQKKCSNYYLAFIHIARLDIQDGNYDHAMQLLKMIGEKQNYSEAFQQSRNQQIRQLFKPVLICIIIAVVLFLAFKMIKKKFRWKLRINNRIIQELLYAKYVIFHPMDGFWDIKREHRGSGKSAAILAGIALIFYMIRSRFSGYLVTNQATEQGLFTECLIVVLPLFLWCVSNWCFTTLMDGKGTFGDVCICTSYALTPYILLSPVLFLMSYAVSLEEMPFYTYLDYLTIAWVGILLLFGMMMTHDYSFGKGILTAVLTVVGILIIIFISLLLLNLCTDGLLFFQNIYDEIVFRFR